MFQLFQLFKKKSELGIENLVKQVTIIKTKPKTNVFYEQYYKYSELSYIYDVPIQILEYEGKNHHASYDQWLIGIEKNKHLDYHLLIEDDYCINPNNYNFDTEVIDLYNKYFPDKNGYLCSLACELDGHPYHAAISNGLVHKNITDHVSLKGFYDFCLHSNQYAQVLFSQYFLQNNISIKGINDVYETLFWNGTIQNFTAGGTKKQLFVPVQYFDMYFADILQSDISIDKTVS